MNIRKIREDLGKVRTSCQRRNIDNALALVISSLKAIGSQQPPTEIRSALREAIGTIAGDPAFKAVSSAPLVYQPGKEPALLAHLLSVRKTHDDVKNKEDYETALNRKLAIDHALRDGRTFLSRGRVAEAEECFVRAEDNVHDETDLFAMIARAYMQAGELNRAIGHLRTGLKLAPADAGLRELAETCLKLKQQAGK